MNTIAAHVHLKKLFKLNPFDSDSISLSVLRFGCLREHLPADQTVGYFGTKDRAPVDIIIINYSLPPHEFVLEQKNSWIVVDFPDREGAIKEIAKFSEYRTVHDCGNGILLLHTP